MIDCSHGNSNKDYLQQPVVAADIAQQIAGGSGSICGLMLESHLVEGRQDIVNGRQALPYGQSVTDACIGWDATAAMLEPLADARPPAPGRRHGVTGWCRQRQGFAPFPRAVGQSAPA